MAPAISSAASGAAKSRAVPMQGTARPCSARRRWAAAASSGFTGLIFFCIMGFSTLSISRPWSRVSAAAAQSWGQSRPFQPRMV